MELGRATLDDLRRERPDLFAATAAAAATRPVPYANMPALPIAGTVPAMFGAPRGPYGIMTEAASLPAPVAPTVADTAAFQEAAAGFDGLLHTGAGTGDYHEQVRQAGRALIDQSNAAMLGAVTALYGARRG